MRCAGIELSRRRRRRRRRRRGRGSVDSLHAAHRTRRRPDLGCIYYAQPSSIAASAGRRPPAARHPPRCRVPRAARRPHRCRLPSAALTQPPPPPSRIHRFHRTRKKSPAVLSFGTVANAASVPRKRAAPSDFISSVRLERCGWANLLT